MERALEIDPSLPADLPLALMHQHSWRWREALAAYGRAAERSSALDGLVRHYYGWFSAFSGEHARAMRLFEENLRFGRNVPAAYMDLGIANAHYGNLQAAAAAYRESVALQPRNPVARVHLGIVEAVLGNDAAAEAEFRFLERFLGDNRVLVMLPELAIGYALVGRQEEVAKLVAEIEAVGRELDVGAGSYAMAYLAAGDRDKTLQWLEAAVEKVRARQPDQGFYSLMLIKHNVVGHPLLEEPRFRELRAQLGAL